MKKYLLIFITVFMSSCFGSDYIESEPEIFILNYNNGNKFCEGNYSIYKKGDKVRIYKDGVWKYYSFDGKLEVIKEYDYDELKNYKKYNSLGKIESSKIIADRTTTYTKYYDNGNIKYESITEYETEIDSETDEDGTHYYETEHSYKTIKNYYRNGQLNSLQKDDGTIKFWDDKGSLVLEYDIFDY